MHDSAMKNVKQFIDTYLKDGPLKILDVGSLDINGSLRSLFKRPEWSYTGIDTQKGKNVDIVLKPPNVYKYPFEDNHFDAVVSSSCFEHNEMFWLNFSEMVRVTKNGGHMFITAPYKDGIHREPVDCWRFLPDGFRALTKWCPQAVLLDAFIDTRPHRDCCGTFRIEK